MEDDVIEIEEEAPEVEEETPEVEEETPEVEEGVSDDPAPVKPPTRAQQEIIKLRERAQKAEAEIEKARAELEAAKKPATNEDQALWEKEEATLKKVDPNSWEAYNISVARGNRANQKEIAALKMQSADIEDKRTFEQLKLDKPKIYEAYKDEVEKRYQGLKATGHIVPRLMICDNILGEALRTGKLKTKPSQPVNRGEPPGARSDSRKPASPGRNTPEAIAKRLENISI